MKKPPQIIVRRGDRFVIDEHKLLPYLRKHRDLVQSAVAVACQHYIDYPSEYRFLSAQDKLIKMNDILYSVLAQWGLYKEKK